MKIVWIHSVENGLSRPAICNCIVDLIVKIRHLVLVDRRGIRVQYIHGGLEWQYCQYSTSTSQNDVNISWANSCHLSRSRIGKDYVHDTDIRYVESQ